VKDLVPAAHELGPPERVVRTHFPIGCSLFTAVSVLFVVNAGALAADGDGLESRDREELLGYARTTWTSVAAMGEAGTLPVDGLFHQRDGIWRPSVVTSPPDIASYLWSVLAAERLKIIGADEAEHRAGRILQALERLDRVHGFFYDDLDARAGKRLETFPGDDKPIQPVASLVDNGWLAAALIMVRNSCPTLRDRADALLKPMDFGFFYEPFDPADPRNHPGQFHLSYQVNLKTYDGFIRIINTEQRIASYVGIARGQIPPDHYYRLERTLRAGEQEQGQKPEGTIRTFLGVPVFEGHYSYRGMRIVPSWGGSMFEDLMVTLFVPEEQWAPRSWGVNHPLYVRAQIEHGLDEAKYGYWGFSPACNPDGGYKTYGVDALGADPLGYRSNNDDVSTKPPNPPPGRFTNGIVTPHASFLALRFAPRAAMANLRKLRGSFPPLYGDHGFMDSVNVSTGTVADRILLLDQGMILAAIANALADDAMRKAFVDGPSERILRPLIAPEEFTAGVDSVGSSGPASRSGARPARNRLGEQAAESTRVRPRSWTRPMA
jgi:hypothetical protein